MCLFALRPLSDEARIVKEKNSGQCEKGAETEHQRRALNSGYITELSKKVPGQTAYTLSKKKRRSILDLIGDGKLSNRGISYADLAQDFVG
jgi:hypothetical protein